jgi:hypothetical protein
MQVQSALRVVIGTQISSCKARNTFAGLCTGNLYQITYVATANGMNRARQPQEHTMRKFASIVLPIIAAASVSGLMLSATIA